MRVCFTNLGCKLNQAELERYAQQFHAAGYRVVSGVEQADLHVINSCTVTHLAARTSRKTARRGARLNPRLKTVLTGCWASDEPGGAEALAGVDLVVTNDRKERLLELVQERFPAPEPRATPEDEGEVPVPYVPLAFGNTRALLKVEDGCNMSCAFCIIPSTRGRQRSRTVEECVAELRRWVEGGYREVVVTGVQISAYRSGEYRLVDLVRALLAETSVERLRLTSIAPWQLRGPASVPPFALLPSERLHRDPAAHAPSLQRRGLPAGPGDGAGSDPGGRHYHRRDRRLSRRDGRGVR